MVAPTSEPMSSMGPDIVTLAMIITSPLDTYSAAKLIFDTSLALFIAVQLDKNVPLKKFLRSTYFAPVVVPMVASSLIWIWFYDPQVGPFNQILSLLGLPQLKWLYSEHTAMISILIFSIWKGLGYNVVLFLSGLQNISDSYLEAARLDGATEWQLFWKVKFPLLRPITNFVVIMCIINSFKVFREIYLLTGDYPYETLYMLQHFMNNTFRSLDYQKLSAAAVVMALVMVVLIALLFKIEDWFGKDVEG